MRTITLEFPDFPEFPFTVDDEYARELRLAAAIFWYDRGSVSQGAGAKIAGMTRSAFIDALGRAGVDALQTTREDLENDRKHLLDT